MLKKSFNTSRLTPHEFVKYLGTHTTLTLYLSRIHTSTIPHRVRDFTVKPLSDFTFHFTCEFTVKCEIVKWARTKSVGGFISQWIHVNSLWNVKFHTRTLYTKMSLMGQFLCVLCGGVGDCVHVSRQANRHSRSTRRRQQAQPRTTLITTSRFSRFRFDFVSEISRNFVPFVSFRKNPARYINELMWNQCESKTSKIISQWIHMNSHWNVKCEISQHEPWMGAASIIPGYDY